MVRTRVLAAVLATASLLLVTAQGCGGDDDLAGKGPGTNTRKDGGGSGNDAICLQNNCTLDRDCADCEGEATTCFQAEHRCVACGENAGGKTCASGSKCTKYGSCVPSNLECPEANGVPSGTCKNNADCAACGPKFRICNAAIGKCVGCLVDNVTNCQSTDVCKGDTCVAKCPKDCNKDDDCGSCGTDTKPARACNKHQCAQCSPTKPCPNGERCDLDHGTCIKGCGLGRPGKTNCTDDNNCAGCQGTTDCKQPINGGEGAGTCVAPVNGCSDIGKGIVVLPEPFSRVTQACSNDPDCANVSADLNVGKILRDATGLDVIKDGNLSYAMHACASVEVLDTKCGVCVPCKKDTDCQDISVSQVAGDLFGPLGSVGAAILLDKAFGPNDHKVHMFCQKIAGDYGACVPCPNMLSRCAQATDQVPPTGECKHDECATGDKLGLQCSTCVAAVCANDPYCCVKEWDEQCKKDVDLYCKDKTCEPDKCVYRDAGWYCRTDPTQGGYKCGGEFGKEVVLEGRQCPTNQKCTTTEPGPKALAVLCDTETVEGGPEVPGCPAGSKGRPKCVPVP